MKELVCRPPKSGVPIYYRKVPGGYRLTRAYTGQRIQGVKQFSTTAGDFTLDMGRIEGRPESFWDGASGPTWDTCSRWVGSTFRASYEHDKGYSAGKRLGFALRKDRERFRKAIDDRFLDLLKADGMPFIRRWYYYRAVRWFGEPAFNGVAATKRQIMAAKIVAPCMVKSLQCAA